MRTISQQQVVNRFGPYYNAVLTLLVLAMFVLLVMVGVVFYQILHRPLPSFAAVSPDQKMMPLDAFETPNFMPDTLLRWVSKATVAAYTFDFVNYNQQAAVAARYFTDSGWKDYKYSVAGLIEGITQKKLFVNSVVSGVPVIANQGVLPGKGYQWRIQAPFLVTYQSAESAARQRYTVTVMLVKVPTYIDPAGIGIEQFIMSR